MFLAASGGIVWISWSADPGAPLVIGVYGIVALSYLFIKLLAAFRYRHFGGATPQLSVAVVVPVYNEDPVMLAKCLLSIVNQTVAPKEIFVIDDGSADARGLAVAQRALEGIEGIHLKRFHGNRGKRQAQGWAFRRTQADVVLTVDSDTILDRRCIESGLKPFGQADVMAVCGNVRVLNRDRNLLTRLLDLRYTNAFVYERAAYSTFDSVLCATGVCTFYRRELIDENLDDYLTQTFLGVEVSYGDDRRLTNYALAKGRVVFQDTAMAATLAPERLDHFLRQQTRWNKSFFRETLYAITSPAPACRMVAGDSRTRSLALLLLVPIRCAAHPTSNHGPVPRLLLRRLPDPHGIRPISPTRHPQIRSLPPSPHLRSTPHPHPHPRQSMEPPHHPQRRMGHPEQRNRGHRKSNRPQLAASEIWKYPASAHRPTSA